MACSASPNIVAKKKSCFNIIRGANSILFGMSLADAARVAQEVTLSVVDGRMLTERLEKRQTAKTFCADFLCW